MQNPRIAAIEQMLVSEIRAGRLPADSTQNVLSSIGNYSESLVTREALKGLAEQKGLTPKFLFASARQSISEVQAQASRAVNTREASSATDASERQAEPDGTEVQAPLKETPKKEPETGQTRYSWSRGYVYPSAAGANTGFGSVFGEGDAYMTTQKSPSFGSGTGMAEYANRAQRTRERGSTRTVHWCTIEIAADRNQKVTQWWLAEHSTPSVCTPYFQALAH